MTGGGIITLAEFIGARLGEDEAWARECLLYGPDAPDMKARVLREVAAKRAILELADMYWRDGHDAEGGVRLLAQCSRQVLQRLACVWQDHPDYDAGWKP